LDLISKSEGWECLPTRGTFYVFPRVARLGERMARWEQQASIFALAGHHFGDGYAEHVRFCFYRPIEELRAIFSNLRALG
jgi:aspartate/methionine/tyrosine aminotransferase